MFRPRRLFVFTLAAASLAAPDFAPAATGNSGDVIEAGAECARNEAELEARPGLAAIVNAMGGVSELQGIWKFSFLGRKKNTVVFQSRPNAGFMARLNESPFEHVRICPSDQTATVRIEIVDPEDPQQSYVIVKKGPGADEMYLSSGQPDWKFYTFRRKAERNPGYPINTARKTAGWAAADRN